MSASLISFLQVNLSRMALCLKINWNKFCLPYIRLWQDRDLAKIFSVYSAKNIKIMKLTLEEKSRRGYLCVCVLQ